MKSFKQHIFEKLRVSSKNGNIHKEYKGCRTFVGDKDDFKITFPIEATPEEKVLIIGAVIMMDFLYYEDKSKDGSSQA